MRGERKRWWSSVLAMALTSSALLSVPVPAAADTEPMAEETEVVFTIGSRIYTVDGKQFEMDVAPRVDPGSNRTLLPVRYVAEAMNAAVYYNPEGQRINIVHNETYRMLDLTVGDPLMQVSDAEDQSAELKLDQAPVVDPPGRTMLPVRAVAESLYGEVSFDARTNQVRIVRPANTPPTKEPAPQVISFGDVEAMDHQNMERHPNNIRTIPIVNRGQGDLLVDGIEFEEGEHFNLCGKQFERFVLKPGESRMILVCAAAHAPGEFKDVIRFESRVRIPTDLIIKPISIWVKILGCKVAIDGGGQRPDITTTGSAPKGAAGIDRPVVNVGQHIQLQASVSSLWSPFTYQWTVNGAHIKDYQEKTSLPWSTTPMTSADYKNATISYYWKQTGFHAVSVKVTNRLGFTCTATTTFFVERNAADINRQAEDFYTWNHGSAVLVEHRQWHTANPYIPCAASGTVFKNFHNAYIARFNSWRSEFGYPAITIWNPATPLPGGIANSHVGRNPGYNPALHQLPSYLTAIGGAAASPCFGAQKKSDFANANQFWIEVEGPYHNSIHGAIGGDMGWVTRAPKDPIFWRFHSYVDSL